MADSPFQVLISADLDRESIDQVYKEIEQAAKKMTGKADFQFASKINVRDQIRGLMQITDQAGKLLQVSGDIEDVNLGGVFRVALNQNNGILQLTKDLQKCKTASTALSEIGTGFYRLVDFLRNNGLNEGVSTWLTSMTKSLSEKFGPHVGQAMINSIRPYSEQLAEEIERALSGGGKMSANEYIEKVRNQLQSLAASFAEISSNFNLGNITKKTDLSGAMGQITEFKNSLDTLRSSWTDTWYKLSEDNDGDPLSEILSADAFENYTKLDESIVALGKSVYDVRRQLETADTEKVFPGDIDRKLNKAAESVKKNKTSIADYFAQFEQGEKTLDTVNAALSELQKQTAKIKSAGTSLSKFTTPLYLTDEQASQYADIRSEIRSTINTATVLRKNLNKLKSEFGGTETPPTPPKQPPTPPTPPPTDDGAGDLSDEDRRQRLRELTALYTQYSDVLSRINEIRLKMAKIPAEDTASQDEARANLAIQEQYRDELLENINSRGELVDQIRVASIETRAAQALEHKSNMQGLADTQAQTAALEAEAAAREKALATAAKRESARLGTAISTNDQADQTSINAAQNLYSQLVSGGYTTASSADAITKAVDTVIARLVQSNKANAAALKASAANLVSAEKELLTIQNNISSAFAKTEDLGTYGFNVGQLNDVAAQVVNIYDLVDKYKAAIQSGDQGTQTTLWAQIQKSINAVNAEMESYTKSGEAFSTQLSEAEAAYTRMVDLRAKTTVDAIKGETDTSTGQLNANLYAQALADANLKLQALNMTEQQFQSVSTVAAKAAETEMRKVAQATDAVAKSAESANAAQTKLASNVATSALAKQITNFKSSNSKAAFTYIEEIETMLHTLQTGSASLTQNELAAMRARFTEIQTQAKQLGITGQTAFEHIRKAYMKFGGWSLVTRSMTMAVQSFKKMVSAAVEIDSALTQLQIVCGLTSDQLQRVGDEAARVAVKVGTSITDLLGSVETYARLGYSISDAMNLSEFTAMFANVAAIDTSAATDSITAIMKGFNMTADDAEKITDILTKVGQEYAVSAGELGVALQNGGAALATSNNTLEEAVALVAAGKMLPGLYGNIWPHSKCA